MKLGEKSRKGKIANQQVSVQNEEPNKNNENIENVKNELYGEDIINYYEMYGFEQGDDWEKIKSILREELKKWQKRSSTTPDKDTLEEIFKKIEEIGKALQIFNPKNPQERLEYDAALKAANRDKQDEEKHENSKKSLENILSAIRKNPVSLTHLKEVQKQLAERVNDTQREQAGDVIDYYEKYGITPNDDIKDIRLRLQKQSGILRQRASNSVLNGPNESLENEISIITDALRIFNPKHPERLEEYNIKLMESKKEKGLKNTDDKDYR